MLERLTAFMMGLFGPPNQYRRIIKFLVGIAAIVGPTLLLLRFFAHGAAQCLALDKCDTIIPYLIDHTLVKILISVFPVIAILFALLMLIPNKQQDGHWQMGCGYFAKIIFACLVACLIGRFFWGFLSGHRTARLIFAGLVWTTVGEGLVQLWKKPMRIKGVLSRSLACS